jgi:type I restriction-modification system DNA methylase subunit
MASLDEVVTRLGIADSKHYVSNLQSNREWKTIVPYRLQKGLEEIAPDSLYVSEDKVLILFFDFTNRSMDESEISQKVWNLGGVPIVYFISEDQITIYNGYLFNVDHKNFQPLNIRGRQIETLNYWDLVSGKLWSELSQSNRVSRVDEYLLNNIQTAQQILLEDGLAALSANSLIGRLLFCRYLLDREVNIGGDYFTDKDSFLSLIIHKEQLYSLFNYLNEKFNGDLFPVTEDELSSVTNQHLIVLQRLFRGDELATGQMSLFDYYNFKIIPVELISEVYERFMGIENQRDEGAYYTPSFLVDYLLAKTVKKRLEESNFCKVLDPSCGSGIFLVETLRSIIEKNKSSEGTISKSKLTEIVENNIYGVDKDDRAVNLTIFSLYLTLLDYQQPRDITTFRLPDLKNKNIFSADFFDIESEFNEVLRQVEFDYIIGNPPWKSEAGRDYHYAYYTSNRLPISDRQIAQTFMLRVDDFAQDTTKFALILTSKILYNNNAQAFRKLLLERFTINEILELSAVRKQIFHKAVAPSFIMFYQKARQDNIPNVILHTSLKPNIFLKYLNLIAIEKSDRKRIQQSYFLDYDWLWKVMLYGNALDFAFLKRLISDTPSLNYVISDANLSVGQGVQVGGGDQNDAHHLVGKKFLDTSSRKKALEKFLVKDEILDEWDVTTLHRPRDPRLFEAPYVLLRKGLGSDFASVSAYSENDYVFTDSVTAIKGALDKKNTLMSITGFLNSAFSSYFNLLQGSSVGVEREQGHNENDRFRIPVVVNGEIANTVQDIQAKKERFYQTGFYDAELEDEIKALSKKLDNEVYKALGVSVTERLIIDYATDISIPLYKGITTPYDNARDEDLIDYAKLFADHFSVFWNSSQTGFLHADIYRDNYVAGINFTVSDSPREPSIILQDQEDTVVQAMANQMDIATETVTDRVFIQKDIRGLNKDSFYVVKPNELKNWHKAIALVDVADFMAAMVKGSE